MNRVGDNLAREGHDRASAGAWRRILYLGIGVLALLAAGRESLDRARNLGLVALLLAFGALFTMPPLIFWFLDIHRHRTLVHRLRERRCPACGYDVRACTARCAECGGAL